MAYKCRVQPIGGIYHIIQRGNNRNSIFREEIDKGYFIKLLKKYKLGLGYKVYGFVLMDNHYHLILQTLGEKLQNVMHRINLSYSRFFNNKYERLGHTFQGRYKSILVQDEKYLLSLLRYIHQNPIKANLCNNLKDYRWSSDYYYRTNYRCWVDIDLILNMLSSDRKQAMILYREFIDKETTDDEDIDEAFDFIRDDAYKEMVKTTVERSKRPTLDEILKMVVIDEDMIQDIKSGKRYRDLTAYKIRYIEKALEWEYSQKEIAANISITENSVYRLKKKT